MLIEIHQNSFAAALCWLREGKKVWRDNWPAKLELININIYWDDCPCTDPELYQPDQEDILAFDWNHD